MPNYNYQRGVRLERKLVNEAKKNGCLAFRSAGSHSPVDVIIINPMNNEIKLIQCKTGKKLSVGECWHIRKELEKWEGDFKVIGVLNENGKERET